MATNQTQTGSTSSDIVVTNDSQKASTCDRDFKTFLRVFGIDCASSNSSREAKEWHVAAWASFHQHYPAGELDSLLNIASMKENQHA
jgi:hypothetical protein